METNLKAVEQKSNMDIDSKSTERTGGDEY